jgi:hypothetical protein
MTMPVRPVRVRAGIVEDFILTINFAISVTMPLPAELK